MPHLDANQLIRIPTGVETTAYEQPTTTPVFVITSSASPTKARMSANSLNPLSPRIQQHPVTSTPKRQEISNKHAVLPAIGSTYNHMQQETLDMPSTEELNHPQPAPPSPNAQIPGTTAQVGFEPHGIYLQNDRNSVGSTYHYGKIPTLVQPEEIAQYPSIQQYSQPAPTITTEPPHDHNSASCHGCGRHLPVIKQEPIVGEEHNHVQQWLVNPNHPYNISPTPQIITTPSLPKNQTVTINAPIQHRHLQKRKNNIPIRYMEAPQHQVTNKSGKLLTPEDALKRTLKSKKIPPLTKRNSLRSIFSDASSNLEKIAEELDEEAKNNGNAAEEEPVENETEEQLQVRLIILMQRADISPSISDLSFVSSLRKAC